MKKALLLIIVFSFILPSICFADLSDDIKSLEGQKYIYPTSIDIIQKYGTPETLSGTNNQRWVAYFPKGDFTIITNKETSVIVRVFPGKKPK